MSRAQEILNEVEIQQDRDTGTLCTGWPCPTAVALAVRVATLEIELAEYRKARAVREEFERESG